MRLSRLTSSLLVAATLAVGFGSSAHADYNRHQRAQYHRAMRHYHAEQHHYRAAEHHYRAAMNRYYHHQEAAYHHRLHRDHVLYNRYRRGY